MVKISLDHCVIKVSNFAVSDLFYRRIFDAEILAVEKDFHVYRIGQQQLNVHGPDLEEPPTQLARLPVRAGNSDLCFEWHGSVLEAIEHLAACSVSVETGPVERFGARGEGLSLYFRDPDGSLLEFITYSRGE